MSCDHSSVSAMCTGRVECFLETEVSFTHRTLAWFKTSTWSEPFFLCGWPQAISSLAGFLRLHTRQSQQKSVSGRATRQARQTLEKAETDLPFFLSSLREESGKLAPRQLWQITLMSAVPDTNISRELDYHGNGGPWKHVRRSDMRWPMTSRISVWQACQMQPLMCEVINKKYWHTVGRLFTLCDRFQWCRGNSIISDCLKKNKGNKLAARPFCN